MQGQFPISNPFLALPPHPHLFSFPSASTAQAASPFAFSQQRPVSADNAQQVPKLFSFGEGIGSVTESEAFFAGEQHVKAAGQQADAGQPYFGFDTQAAGARSGQSHLQNKSKHHGWK